MAAAYYSRTLPNQNIAYHKINDISNDYTHLALFRQLWGEQIVRCMANDLDIGHRRKDLKYTFLPARSVATRYIN